MDKRNDPKWTYVRTSRLNKLELREEQLKKLKRTLKRAIFGNIGEGDDNIKE